MARSRRKAAKQAATSSRFVLDCSIVFAWYFADESSDYADSIAATLSKSTAVVPTLWVVEVANTLLSGERRGRSTEAQATAFLARLANFPIAIDNQNVAAVWNNALPIARAHQLSAYDAVYLELALREGLPIATLDGKLQLISKSLGIQRYEP